MKFNTLTLAAGLAVFVSTATLAQTKAPEPDYTIAYSAGIVTDYRFRGIAQTAFKPALQLTADFAHKSGFYLGAFGSNVNWIKDFNGATKGSYEVDLYGGYKGSITKELGYDLGLITYIYPGNNSGAAGTLLPGQATNANTTEIYGALTYDMFTAKYSRSTGTFLGFLNSSGSQYLDLSANVDVGNGFTVTPHIGRQTVKGQTPNGVYSYTDYSVTVAKDFGNGLSATGALVATNTAKPGPYTDFNNKNLGKSTVVVGLKYSF